MMMPEDVMIQILLWLPVVSLLRFKLVCKSWRSFIESPTFISQHNHLHLHLDDEDDEKEESLVIMDPNQFVHICSLTISFSFFSGTSFQVSRALELPHRFQKPLSDGRIIASCNGIICLNHKFYTDISLWNPATKQFRLLPESAVPAPPHWSCRVDHYFGFGFDAKTNDYKVVRIIIGGNNVTSNVINSRRVDVYSLRKDSWTTIEDVVFPINYIICDPKAPFRNGIYCWFGRFYSVEKDSEEDVILSFDFSNEVFETMPPPDANKVFDGTRPLPYSTPKCPPELALLKGNIACIYWVVNSPQGENWHCKIWVLNEYGVKESWTNLYTVALESDAFPKAVSNTGKIIWIKRNRDNSDAKLCLCDTVTQELKVLPYHGYIPQTLEVVFYKESLVSIERANGAANRVTSEDLPENCQPST